MEPEIAEKKCSADYFVAFWPRTGGPAWAPGPTLAVGGPEESRPRNRRDRFPAAMIRNVIDSCPCFAGSCRNSGLNFAYGASI